jgi:hypothetical protein
VNSLPLFHKHWWQDDAIDLSCFPMLDKKMNPKVQENDLLVSLSEVP